MSRWRVRSDFEYRITEWLEANELPVMAVWEQKAAEQYHFVCLGGLTVGLDLANGGIWCDEPLIKKGLIEELRKPPREDWVLHRPKEPETKTEPEPGEGQ